MVQLYIALGAWLLKGMLHGPTVLYYFSLGKNRYVEFFLRLILKLHVHST